MISPDTDALSLSDSDLRPSVEPESAEMTATLDEAGLHAVTVQTEKISGRQRQIRATIWIPRSVEHVWEILTDYDHLADFIPNLTASRVLPSDNGLVRLEQIGAQCWLNLKFCARVVLQMEESFPSEIRFHMLEGDFKDFQGTWQLAAESRQGQVGTLLSYNLRILPRLAMPVGLVEHHLCHNLTLNLAAICQQSTTRFGLA